MDPREISRDILIALINSGFFGAEGSSPNAPERPADVDAICNAYEKITRSVAKI